MSKGPVSQSLSRMRCEQEAKSQWLMVNIQNLVSSSPGDWMIIFEEIDHWPIIITVEIVGQGLIILESC